MLDTMDSLVKYSPMLFYYLSYTYPACGLGHGPEVASFEDNIKP
jgi:hypothetical protein